MPWKAGATVDTINTAWDKVQNKSDPTDLKAFLSANFDDPGSDLISVSPPDWEEKPSFLDNISDSEMCSLAKSINLIWPKLAK
jgi:hypothetical protein